MAVLYLFRHGETVRNSSGFYTDAHGLTDKGKEDVRKTAYWMNFLYILLLPILPRLAERMKRLKF